MTLTVDPEHAGLYLFADPGLTVDPEHPGFYLLSGPSLTPDPEHPGFYLFVEATGELIPDLVAGRTHVTIGFADLMIDPIVGRTGVAVELQSTAAHVAGDVDVVLDPIRGRTDVALALHSSAVRLLLLDVVGGLTTVRIFNTPDLSRNTPILLAFSCSMLLESTEPLVSE